jgi:hypothetical protein
MSEMAGFLGQFRPYTFSIYTTLHRTGRETYGRFDLGTYKGVFRFSTQTKDAGRYDEGYKDEIDEFLLDKDDLPSAVNPTRCYRWRGKEDGEDQHLYTMTFSIKWVFLSYIAYYELGPLIQENLTLTLYSVAGR